MTTNKANTLSGNTIEQSVREAIGRHGPLVIWENEDGLAYAWGRIPGERERGDGGDYQTLGELLAGVGSPTQRPSSPPVCSVRADD